ncbi:hypothetical protein RCL1_008364 [Eukaryota sp. TZLM3-RCL]
MRSNPFKDYCQSVTFSNISAFQFSTSKLLSAYPNQDGRFNSTVLDDVFRNNPWFHDFSPLLRLFLQESQSQIATNTFGTCSRIIGGCLALPELFSIENSLKILNPNAIASFLAAKYCKPLFQLSSNTGLTLDDYSNAIRLSLLFHCKKGQSLTKFAGTPCISDLFLLLSGFPVSDSVLIPASVAHVFNLFQSMTRGGQRMSRDQFCSFGNGMISPTLLKSTFDFYEESNITFDDFFTFCLALNFSGTEFGVRFILKRLDVEVKGFLSKNDVRALLFELLQSRERVQPSDFGLSGREYVEALVAEIFDSCLMKKCDVIRVDDLIRLPSSTLSQLITTLIDSSTW